VLYPKVNVAGLTNPFFGSMVKLLLTRGKNQIYEKQFINLSGSKVKLLTGKKIIFIKINL